MVKKKEHTTLQPVKEEKLFVAPRTGEKDHVVFIKKAGFKKLAGSILCIIAGILYLVPHPAAASIGTGLSVIGGLLLGIGSVHTLVKEYKGIDRRDSVWVTIYTWIRSLRPMIKK